MSSLRGFINGLGLLGPGLDNSQHACEVFTGQAAYQARATVLPAPLELPAAERRRTGRVVKLALAIGQEALLASRADASDLRTVFTSSGGDAHNIHAICETLASGDPQISPTRFHNSVHNAPAGYWSIARACMAPSNVLCAYDASFGAGLLESLCQIRTEPRPTLLIAYDVDYPEPLRQVRPIPDAFGLAMLLAPEPGTLTLGSIEVELLPADDAAPVSTLKNPALEKLRRAIPAARALPLIEALAHRSAATLIIDYLDDLRLQIRFKPWR
jgi:hypothetical protein